MIAGPRPSLRAFGVFAALALAAALLLAASASAATFTVTNTSDAEPGSLRKAIEAANAAGPGNTIAFAIPGPGPYVISPASELPVLLSDDTTIDGCTQPGADCTSSPARPVVQIDGVGLRIGYYRDTVRGLSITGVTAPANATGITAARNGREGVFSLPQDLTIEDCYIGIAPDGSAAGNAQGISVLPHTRQTAPVNRLRIRDNVIGANQGAAINLSAFTFISSAPLTGLQITGNIIGLDPTGTEPRPNTGDGIVVEISGNARITDNTIANNGGVGLIHRGRNQAVPHSDPALDAGTVIEGNVVSGNAKGGLLFDPDAGVNVLDPYSGPITVLGNEIADNGAAGVSVIKAADTTRPNIRIGGTAPGEANLITGNDGPGVAIGDNPADTSVAVTVRGNSIYGNTGLPIDLASDGATENAEAGITRPGPNSLLNHPMITAIDHGSVIVDGAYAGPANAAFTLDFYKSETAEGPQTWIGSTSVSTDAEGNASYHAEFEPDVPGGWLIAATATDANGSTS
ncbi:MAG TPA: right-handed parallel beta-helix repeat-containing protein, partial [Solirubrobacterales bacterium]|nr:right-handed parallel beta-helix repeat-containing protein [Solirubrobacterales bacterium]